MRNCRSVIANSSIPVRIITNVFSSPTITCPTLANNFIRREPFHDKSPGILCAARQKNRENARQQMRRCSRRPEEYGEDVLVSDSNNWTCAHGSGTPPPLPLGPHVLLPFFPWGSSLSPPCDSSTFPRTLVSACVCKCVRVCVCVCVRTEEERRNGEKELRSRRHRFVI